MKAITRDTFLTQAFVLRESDVRYLVEQLMKRGIKDIEFQIRCRDSLKRKFDDVEELLAYNNAAARRIQRLSIVGRSDRMYVVRVTLEDSDRSNVYVDLDAGPDLAVALNETIETMLEAVRPWYWRVAQTNFFSLLYGMAFVVFVLLIAYGALRTVISGPTLETPEAHARGSVTLAVMLLSVLGSAALAFALEILRARAFPMAVFALGQGKKRFETLERFQTTVVIGFFVSVVASLVAAVLIS